jgi:hypothetical protein
MLHNVGMEPTYQVVWPKSARGVQQRRAATRLASLDGKRIAFVWDYMFRGEELFPALAHALRERFPTVEIVDYNVFGNIHGPNEASIIADLPKMLQEHRIDAAVTGNGC